MGTPSPRAIVRYARISREEAALNLCRTLRASGFEASAVYSNGQPECVEIDDHHFAWDDVIDVTQVNQPVLQVVVMEHGLGLPLPSYESVGASGMDLRAAVAEDEVIVLLPGQRRVIPTGLAVAIPVGFEVQIRGRSGLAAKNGIGMVNGVGTIDSDYRGEIGVIMINHGQEAFSIRRGDRVAQMVVAPVVQARWAQVETLDETERGAGGYGSTGKA